MPFNVFKHLKRKSIPNKIFVPMLIVMVLQTVVILVVFLFGGTFSTLNQNEVDILNEKVKNRKDYLESEMVDRWTNLDTFALSIESQTDAILKLYKDASLDNLNARFDAFDGNYSLADIIIRSVSGDMVNAMLRLPIHGAFVVLDNSLSADLPNQEKSGLYIHSNKLGASSMTDLMLKVASPFVRDYLKSEITLSNMQDRFTVGLQDAAGAGSDFFYKPLDLARAEFEKSKFSRKVRDYGYWSRPFKINGMGEQVIAYTVPLWCGDYVYGVMGIEVTIDDFQSLLPFGELHPDNSGVYYLAITNQGMDFDTVLFNGPSFTKIYGDAKSLSAAPQKYENCYTFTKSSGVKDNIVGCIQYLRLYNENSPFAEDSWALVAFLESKVLFSFTNTLQATLLISSIILLIIGCVAVIIISIAISLPILRLTEKVQNSSAEGSLHLGKINIYEIDQLVAEIEKLSKNIAELEKDKKSKLEYERDHDVLTGLVNRRGIYAILDWLALNPVKLKKAAIIMMDLDELKYINDTYGHDFGDRYIKKAADVLKKARGEQVVVSRLGGDEFLMLIYGYESRKEISAIIELLQSEINNCHFDLPDEKSLKIGISGGVAWYPDDSENLETLIKYADFSMYYVKKNFKGRFHEFNIASYNKEAYLESSIEELKKLTNGQPLEYHFQPVVSCKNGEVYGYEAFMRPNANGLTTAPLQIIEAARLEGELLKIEEITWTNSLACFSKYVQASEGKKLFINTLPNQTLPLSFITKIEKLYPEYLKNTVLEFTRDEKVEDNQLCSKRVMADRWRACIALDDFGKGLSEDTDLLRVCPDFVKADIDIVRGIDGDEKKQVTFLNLVSCAKEKNIAIIAEGVETLGEMEFLIKNGADYLQGYFLGRPDPIPEDIRAETRQLIMSINNKNGVE